MTRTQLITAMTVLSVVLLLGGPAVQAEEDKTQKTPQIQIPQPAHHAGAVVRGEEYATVFTIRNNGTADLRLVKADGHCSCISTDILRPVIPPGEEGGVEITFVGRTGVGETTRIIELTSNDPQNRLARMTFAAQVVVPFGFETRALALGKLHHKAMEPVFKKTVILIREPADIELDGLESTSPQITARLLGSGESQAGHQRLEIEVSVEPGLPPGVLNETITATTASGNHPPAILNVTGLITGDVELTPDNLRLLVVETGKRQARDSWKRIYLTGYCPNRPLRVFNCRDSNDLLQLDLVELISGEKFELTVTLDADALDMNSDVTGVISLSTNSPSQPVVTVNYSAAHRLYDKLDMARGKEVPPEEGASAGKESDTEKTDAEEAAEDG